MSHSCTAHLDAFPHATQLLSGIRATHCNTLQHTATHCNTLQHTATHCNVLRHIETRARPDTFLTAIAFKQYPSNSLQLIATHCNSLQLIATHCQSLQQRISMHSSTQHPLNCVSVTLCNTLQLIATHCNNSTSRRISGAVSARNGL